MSTKKKVLISVGAAVIAIVVIYLGFSVYFMNHFYFGTKINGVKVGGKTVEAATDKIQDTMDNYELVIKESDGSEDSIMGSDIGLATELGGQLDTYLDKQNGFAWIVKVFASDSYQADGTLVYDEEKLMAEIDGLACLDEEKQVEPQNATVSEYDAKKGYELVPSVPGTAIEKETLIASIQDSILNLNTELDLEESSCYKQPAVTDDNETLLAAIDQLNKCLNTVITYQVGSSTQVLDASTFQPWLSINEKLEVRINDEELTAYVKSLASTYNTFGSAKKLQTSYGKEVTITNSHYGWKVDNDAEKTAITADILTGEAVTRDLNYSMKANSHNGNDYGNSYVEINLTAQHLFLYVDGKLIVESDFVSGNLAKGYDSPTGAYPLTYKQKNAVLRGEDYTTPVDYWMPFAGNVGMHDATWRSSFGASIYKRDGSHGCINLPHSAAKTIFENISAGFPVLCYTLEGTQSPAGIAQDQAYVVIDAIKKIGTVTLESESKITSCRTQYDALSDMAKGYVTNYSTLTKAESALKKLKDEQAAAQAATETTEGM